jgi:hypothetical protein
MEVNPEMRALLFATTLALSACAATVGASTVGEPVRQAQPMVTELFDEDARRAAICSEARPLDFYDNKEYCLDQP